MGGRYLQAVLLGAGASLLALLLWTGGFLDIWEFVTWRWRVDLMAKPGMATDRIKLILLDQNSLAWGERENGWSWPWPREVYAPIIDYCARNGAKAVIFDFLFTEPSVYGLEDDRSLAAAIDRSPPFVLALYLGTNSGKTSAWPANIPDDHRLRIIDLDDWLASRFPKGLVISRATFPVEDLAARSTLLASVTQDPDFDGIFRRCRLFQVFDGRLVPSLSLAAYFAPLVVDSRTASASGTGSPAPLAMAIRDGCLRVGDRCIPIDESGRSIVRYRGPVSSYETFSAAAVIQSELRLQGGELPVIEESDVFKDSYVFFGTSAAGLLDLRPTPISRIHPGVELHATILDNLLSGDFIGEPPRWLTFLTTLSLAVVSSLMLVTWRTAWQSGMICAALLPVPVLVGFLGYGMNYWWPVLVHAIGMTLSLTGTVFLNYIHEGRQKAFIKKAFLHYLSPAVIEKMVEDPSRLVLGGERRELSMLFTDLQGFTTIAERLDPQTLTGLLNDYLSHMTDIIFEEGGTLDKYVGDAFIAFWNAPIDQPDHAARACRAAIRCHGKLEELRREYARKTGALLYARTGIHTGPVVVGNMGSRKRFAYTMLGDAANLASRLEKANKVFGTSMLASEATWGRTDGELLGREIGIVRVSGRKAPVRVYELIGFADPGAESALEPFRMALSLYYARRWDEALTIFQAYPHDPVARVYAKRCQSLMRDPGIPWDGVWTLKEK